MKKYTTTIYRIIFPLFIISNGFAQSSSVAAGGDATGSGGSASFSIGQVAYITCQGSTGSVSCGVQQPFEIIDLSELNENSESMISLSVFPNPSSNYLTIELKEEMVANLSYQLYDSNGKLQQTNVFKSNNEIVSMLEQASGAYFLKIVQNGVEIKSFKIIKN